MHLATPLKATKWFRFLQKDTEKSWRKWRNFNVIMINLNWAKMDTKKERLKYLVGDFKQVISPTSLKLDAKDVVIRNFIRCQKGTCKNNSWHRPNYNFVVSYYEVEITIIMIWCCCTCFKSTCNCCWVYHRMTRQNWACLHMSHDQRCSCLYLGQKDPTGVMVGTFANGGIQLWSINLCLGSV